MKLNWELNWEFLLRFSTQAASRLLAPTSYASGKPSEALRAGQYIWSSRTIVLCAAHNFHERSEFTSIFTSESSVMGFADSCNSFSRNLDWFPVYSNFCDVLWTNPSKSGGKATGSRERFRLHPLNEIYYDKSYTTRFVYCNVRLVCKHIASASFQSV